MVLTILFSSVTGSAFFADCAGTYGYRRETFNAAACWVLCLLCGVGGILGMIYA